MLTSADIAYMQTIQEDAMPTTGYLRARSLAGDGQGGQREIWGDPVTVSCRLAPMSKEDAARYAERLGAASGWVVTVTHDTSVNVYDKITIGSYEYRVLGTQVDESWLTALRAYCARLK